MDFIYGVMVICDSCPVHLKQEGARSCAFLKRKPVSLVPKQIIVSRIIEVIPKVVSVKQHHIITFIEEDTAAIVAGENAVDNFKRRGMIQGNVQSVAIRAGPIDIGLQTADGRARASINI